MRRFLVKLFWFFLPLFTIATCFVIEDPFRIFWYREDPYTDNYLGSNRGWISARMYDHEAPKRKFDSFIFENSRSVAYYATEWMRYLPSGSAVYHFDSAAGSLPSLQDKVHYIVKKGGRLRHVLLLIDHNMLTDKTNEGEFLFMRPPQFTGRWLDFYREHIMAALNKRFLQSYIEFSLTRQYKPYMKGLIKPFADEYDPSTNELQYTVPERMIARNQYYTPERVAVFAGQQFPDSVRPPQINGRVEAILHDVAQVFKEQGTQAKIIISPMYDQVQVNPGDVDKLRALFGAENVYDFSGRSQWSKDYHNYYETSHYRVPVANEILRLVYNLSPEQAHKTVFK